MAGEVVWATLKSYKFWYPALIISHTHCNQKPAKPGHTWVYWFAEHLVSQIPLAKCRKFVDYFNEMTQGEFLRFVVIARNSFASFSGKTQMSLRLKEALQVLASRVGFSVPQVEYPLLIAHL